MPKDQLTNRIRRLRFEHGEMTQQTLADRVGCTRQTIVLLEQSRYVPSLLLAMRIAGAFNARVEDVFSIEVDHSADRTA
ncbi:MAG: helix-turn-helix transcriptional regulator [Phycisphaerae bacterium]|nr:helix-turn-helix transcriptional regulator [Phycisphaerae bacterium]